MTSMNTPAHASGGNLAALLAETFARLAPAPLPAAQADSFAPGHVWLAGAGPGSLECLTLGVVAALARADAIVYDALVNPDVLLAAPSAEKHFVGKRAGLRSTAQVDINALLIRLAGEGKRVLRLKGGDPNVFGRGGEEARALASAGVPFRFLPGLTSGLAALASAGVPATLRGVSQAIILATGHAADAPGSDTAGDGPDWAALAKTGQPIVIYMGLGNLPLIRDQLLAGGLPARTPVAVIHAATTPDEQILVSDLGDVVAATLREKIAAPALVVVGDIVACRNGARAPDPVARPGAAEPATGAPTP